MYNRKAIEHVMSNVRLRREYRKMKKLAFATGAVIGSVAVMAAFSGCHLTVGTPEAIREYHRGLNGMITEGKTSPDKESAYWQTQKARDVEETKRHQMPGILQRFGFFAPAQKPAAEEVPVDKY
jgi:hypothetical protein